MPKRNFGSSFLGGFQQTFNPTFQNVMDNLMQEDRQKKIMEEQNRRELEERQREQTQRSSVIDLLRGGRQLNIPQGLTPVLPQGINKFQPFTQEQTMQGLSGLDKTGQDFYNWLGGKMTPKQQKTVKIDGNVFLESPDFENVPIGDPLYSEPQKDIRIEVINADTIKGQESFKGYKQRVKREYDSNENVVSEELVNNPYKPIIEKIGGDGSKYKKIVDESFKDYDKLKKAYLNSLAVQEAYKRGSRPYYTNPLTNTIQVYTQQQIEDGVKVSKDKLDSYTLTNFSKEAQNYVNTVWDKIPAGKNTLEEAENVWEKTDKDYQDGAMDYSTYQELYFKFIADYGLDPNIKYAGR